MRNEKQFIILEDSQTQGRLIARMVEKSGAKAHVFYSTRDFQANASLGSLKVDAAIVDIHFGDVNGLSLIKPLLDIWPDVILIMMTANDTNDFAILAEARDKGAHLVLKKPFSPIEVKGIVRDVELIQKIGVPRRHVVVIDDNKTTCQIVRNILEACSFRVTTFQVGEFAMGRLNYDRVDAVLTDINMPGMGGGEVVCLVRDIWEDVAILGMSTENSSRDKFHESVDAFVSKPFGPEELVNKINSAINRRNPGCVDFHRSASLAHL